MPVVCTGIGGGGLYGSVDGAATWTQAFNGGSRWAIDVSHDGTTVDAIAGVTNNQGVSSFGGFFTSTDSGKTFNAGGALPIAACDAEQQEFYDMAIAIDPNNSSDVVVGLTGVYSSIDGGTTFQNIENGIHADQHALKIFGGTIFSGNDGGFVTNAGAGWDGSMNAELGITQFQAVGMPPLGLKALVGGTQDNGTQTYSGSKAWLQSDYGDGGYALIDQSNPNIWFNTRFSTTSFIQLGRSKTAGSRLSFKPIGPPPGDPVQFFVPVAEDPTKQNRLLLGTNRIWESCHSVFVPTPKLICDGTTGNPPTWTPISGDLTNGCNSGLYEITDIAIAPSLPSTIYAVTGGGRVYRSIASKCFATLGPPAATCPFDDLTGKLPGLTPGTPLTSVSVSPINPKKLMITASGFTGKHVYLSKDGGNSFTDITGGLPDIPALTGLIDQCAPGKSLLIGTDIGVLHSDDSGASWVNSGLGSLPNVPVYMLRQNANGVVAATHGCGVWLHSGCP